MLNIQKARQSRKYDLSSRRVIHANGQLKSHLQVIRIRGPNQVGGNLRHPGDDPLWNTEAVERLLTKHDTFTAERRKSNRAHSAKSAYHLAMDSREQLETVLEALVKVKRINQATANQRWPPVGSLSGLPLEPN